MPTGADPELTALLRQYPDEEVARLVPCLVLEALIADPATPIPPSLLAIVEQWLASRGLGPSSSPSQVLAELEATYEERPVPQELRLSLKELSGAMPTPGALFGVRHAPPPTSPAPPAGAVKVSPLVRFLLNTRH